MTRLSLFAAGLALGLITPRLVRVARPYCAAAVAAFDGMGDPYQQAPVSRRRLWTEGDRGYLQGARDASMFHGDA